MNDLIPEDISKAAQVKLVVPLRHPPWQIPLRPGVPQADKVPAEGLPVHQFPASGPLPRGNSICAWSKVDAAVITTTQAPSAQGPRAEPAHAWDGPCVTRLKQAACHPCWEVSISGRGSRPMVW